MVSGSRCVFIVGFERCMTTSLAAYLIDNCYCMPLVRGVKEPHVFLRDAAPAVERSRSMNAWPLDASVGYAHNTGALRAITETVADYRVIVCMRDQVDRTVSAYAYYRSSVAHPNDALDLVFGNAATRAALARDESAPAHLRRGPVGRFAFGAILQAALGVGEATADGAVEEFMRHSFAQRLLFETRMQRTTGHFPTLSVLGNSFYGSILRDALRILDPARVLLVTPEANLPYGRVIGEWLGMPASDRALPSINASRLPAPDIEHARGLCAATMGDAFREQTAVVRELAQRCRSSLFSHDALFH